jgi:hypothetical protein
MDIAMIENIQGIKRIGSDHGVDASGRKDTPGSFAPGPVSLTH